MNRKNKDLVDKLVRENIIKSKKVKEAFLKIDREEFVPKKFKDKSHVDKPLPISQEQTISAPHIVAMMTEHLEIEKDSKIMEIGTGSGYQAALLSKIAEESQVHTTEIVPELYEKSKKKLKEYSNIETYKKDGSLGIPEVAPFDRILSTCGAPKVPSSWKKQLKKDGIIIAPIGGKRHQRLIKYMKKEKELKKIDLNIPCAFIPMKGENGF